MFCEAFLHHEKLSLLLMCVCRGERAMYGTPFFFLKKGQITNARMRRIPYRVNKAIQNKQKNKYTVYETKLFTQDTQRFTNGRKDLPQK